MRLLIAALAAAGWLAGCKSPNPSNLPPPAGARDHFKYGTGDGQTMTTAVEIRTRSENEGELLVRDWIRRRYPGYAIRFQDFIEQRDRAYHVITIIGPSDTTHRLYFDISSYYRGTGNQDSPQPLS